MSKVKDVIDALGKAIEMEHRVMEYYKRAGDEARNSQISTGMYRLEERHQIHIERLEAHREHLHKVAGDGFLTDALTSFGDALTDIVAGLPRTFIESETFPTFDTLVREEEGLIAYYQRMRGDVDGETASLIAMTIDDCNDSIAVLHQLDTLESTD
jgi:hypothetical protein